MCLHKFCRHRLCSMLVSLGLSTRNALIQDAVKPKETTDDNYVRPQKVNSLKDKLQYESEIRNIGPWYMNTSSVKSLPNLINSSNTQFNYIFLFISGPNCTTVSLVVVTHTPQPTTTPCGKIL